MNIPYTAPSREASPWASPVTESTFSMVTVNFFSTLEKLTLAVWMDW